MSVSKAQRRIWTLDTVLSRCDEVGDCWLWNQGISSTGYPQASIDGRPGTSVRVYVYDVLMARKRPAGSNIAARCDNRICCSPLCLVHRSPSKTMANQWANGKRSGQQSTEQRRQQAIAQGLSKLTPEIVAAIRALPKPVNKTLLAQEHGVHPKTIGDVLSGRSWAASRRVATSVFDWVPA